jgi:hypothetical protein
MPRHRHQISEGFGMKAGNPKQEQFVRCLITRRFRENAVRRALQLGKLPTIIADQHFSHSSSVLFRGGSSEFHRGDRSCHQNNGESGRYARGGRSDNYRATISPAPASKRRRIGEQQECGWGQPAEPDWYAGLRPPEYGLRRSQIRLQWAS